jgi:SHS2 domain-containing protein
MSGDAVYEFVESTTSDLSFVARGPTLESSFTAAAEALLAATLLDPDSLGSEIEQAVELVEPDLELLLLRFLNELVYLRDAKGLLLRARWLQIQRNGDVRLTGRLAGESLRPERHALVGEVKAATAHGLSVVQDAQGWRATATLDV